MRIKKLQFYWERKKESPKIIELQYVLKPNVYTVFIISTLSFKYWETWALITLQSKVLTTNQPGLSRSFKVSGFAFEEGAGTGKAKQENESMASAKWQQSLSLVQFQNCLLWKTYHWLITACKTDSNQTILSLKTESKWVEQEPCLWVWVRCLYTKTM